MTEFSIDSMYFNVIIIVIFNSSRLSIRIRIGVIAAATAATTLLQPATFRLSRIPRISKLP
jgi:hypothetical protein